MKKLSFLIGLLCLLVSQLSFSQTPISKRIQINNPSRTELLQIKDTGIDLSCGAIFKNNSLILELGENELNALDDKGINYSILLNDLIAYYKNKTETELPIAKAQLEAKKLQSLAAKSLSTKSTAIDNLVQYEGCSEIDWDASVPSNFNLGSMGGCLTYSEVLAELDQMRALYPNLISVKTDASPTNQVTHGNSFTNGGQYDSWSGSTVYYVRISDNPDIDEINEPESLYSGMTHSREVSSLMNLMYYMWYILENYNSDAGIKNLVDHHEMYFIPVANPDGLLWNEQIAPSGGGLQRKNLGPYNTGNNDLRGVDLNRNYDYFWGSSSLYGGSSGTQSSNTYRGPSAFSEPETQIVRDFSATKQFKTAMNHHATSNLIPHAYNGYPNAPASGREAEYHKFCHDMTRFNRYIYGEAPDILTIANGDMSDWMLGGASDVNGSNGSGQGILALAPENGAWDGSEGSFWPNATQIVDIAQRAVRMNFMNAYYSGKFVHFHDLNPSNISATSGNFEFGLEYLGQTLGDITLNITPVSGIQSLTPPATQTGWNKLDQRTVTAAYTLDPSIQPNDEIEFQITLSNDDGYVMYRANISKIYSPSLLFSDNPDTDGLSNWTASGGAWGTETTTDYNGNSTTAITDSPSGAYANNQSNTLTLNSSVNLSSSSASVVQFYAKWDLERNFDYVQIEGSTNGSSWIPLCGKYTKPGSDFLTNRYSSGNSSNTSDPNRTSTTNQPSGELLYDGDTMDKWVMEEVLIDVTENSFLFGASNAQFRFVFDSDNTNRADGYPTTFDGFTFDNFKITSLQTPCVLSVPTGVASSNVTETEATITWDNIASATYDLRYRVIGSQNWTEVNGLSVPTTNLTGLANVTDYEVQVRANCSSNSSSYSASINFTTLDVQLNYCTSASTNVNDEFISRVQLNTIDNTSTGQFYSDFTYISTTLTKDAQYSITITPTWTGQSYNESYAVWIDYNRDGDFEDAGEQVFTQGNTQATSVSGNFTIPSNAVENSTRMRVSMKYNAAPTSCETFQYGEVEDYTVIIESAGPDLVAPVITLNGLSPVDITIGETYTEEGATAIDDVDGNITNDIVIAGDIVNTTTIGTYIVTYNVSDAAGNAATEVTRTVNITADVTAPVITLLGASTVNLTLGESYVESGATATDNVDGDLSANVIIGGDVVDTNAIGSYLITYNVGDASGNSALEVIRTVNVSAIVDNTAPVISLNGSASVSFFVGDTYTELGATANDNIDGDISGNIIIGGDSVNSNTAGVYLVTYDVSDAAGNTANQIIRTVTVSEPVTGCSGGITTFPYAEGFEGAIGTWSQSTGDDLNWTVLSGNTPSNNTGPTNATEGSSYIYVEASVNGTGYPNKRAIITSPCFDLSNATGVDFSFQYHMFGATDMGTIDLELSNDNGESWTSIWNQSGNQGNSWLSVTINLNTYVGGSVQLRFNRFVGSTWQADIAIDDISLTTIEEDTTAPVITLNGSTSIDLNIGDVYTEQGATATDNIDGNITANIILAGDIVDTNTAGTYTITYDVSDAAGNVATQVTRTVNIIPDTTAPVITLIGASVIDLNVGDIYTEQGATATDNIDGDITANIIIGGDIVDTNTAGTYTITYDVSDAAGNAATQVTRTVNIIPDTTAPILTLIGASNINLNVGDTYTEQGATANDNKDGDITANILIGGDVVDINSAGTYIVTFDVSDAAGNAATQVTRTVNIIPDTTAPIISLIGASNIDLNIGDTYTEQGATATDNIDGNITANIIIGGDIVDTNTAGTYTITYDVSDAAGNAANQASRIVNIIAAPSNVILHEGFFESGWDGWIDGGSDCARRLDSRSYEGDYSVRIRDNSGTASAMTLSNIDVSPFDEVQVDFYFYVFSLENTEDFWLRYFNGSSWSTIETWARTIEINNNTFYNATVVIPASQFNFASNSGFRFQCDASGNNDQIFIDQVTITGLSTATGSGNSLINLGGATKTSIEKPIVDAEIFKVYPNPVKGNFINVDVPGASKFSYIIINMLGQIVAEGESKKEVEVDRLEGGVYILQVNDGEELITKRFIKE